MVGDILVKLMCLKSFIATIAYGIGGDWNKMVYWLGATILSVSVLVGLK